MTILDSPPTPTPTIDPRLRQRRIDVRRDEGRRRLRLIFVTLGAMAVVAAGFGALHSPLLKVRHVRVSLGEEPAGSGLTAAQVEAQAGFDRQRLMVDVSTGTEAQLIEQLPWVDRANVERDWPGTIRIAVTARHPVAEVDRVPGRPSAGVAVLDATGRVLAFLPAGLSSAGTLPASAGLPPATGSGVPAVPLLDSLPAPGAPGTWIVAPAGAGISAATGPSGAGAAPPGSVNSGTAQGAQSEAAAARAAAEELATAAALPPSLESRVSTITIAANGLQLRVGSVMVLFGDTGELTQKVTALRTVLSDVSLAGIGVVDLRVPDRPALTPSRSTASLSTTAGG